MDSSEQRNKEYERLLADAPNLSRRNHTGQARRARHYKATGSTRVDYNAVIAVIWLAVGVGLAGYIVSLGGLGA